MSASPYDVLVIGGGPAGLAAGVEASGAGLSVAVVDERLTFGGQIFKQPGQGFRVTNAEELGHDYARGRLLIEAAERSGATLLSRTSAVAIRGKSVVLVEEGEDARAADARRVIVAGLPGLDPSRRDHSRRRAGIGQDATSAARTLDRLRRQRAACVGLSRPASRLRRQRDARARIGAASRSPRHIAPRARRTGQRTATP